MRVRTPDRGSQSNQQKANEGLRWIESGPADGCSHMVVHRRCPAMLYVVHLLHSLLIVMHLQSYVFYIKSSSRKTEAGGKEVPVVEGLVNLISISV